VKYNKNADIKYILSSTRLVDVNSCVHYTCSNVVACVGEHFN